MSEEFNRRYKAGYFDGLKVGERSKAGCHSATRSARTATPDRVAQRLNLKAILTWCCFNRVEVEAFRLSPLTLLFELPSDGNVEG